MNQVNQEFNKVVYVVGGDDLIERMFHKRNWAIYGNDTHEKPDLVIFTGGEDVTPSLYHEENVASWCDWHRDAYEIEKFEEFSDTPKAGICRGGQFLNVMSGGRMYQDVDGHSGNHVTYDLETGKEYEVTSTHHQMMRPSDDGEVVGVANETTYVRSAKGESTVEDDIEVVYYAKTKSLCFQPHPEYNKAEQTEEYFFDLLNRYFGVNG